MVRLASLVLFVGIWYVAALLAGDRMLPGPAAVLATVVAEAASGALFVNLAWTLARVLLAFGLAMMVGTALGLVMGRITLADRLGDPWLVVLLNLPANATKFTDEGGVHLRTSLGWQSDGVATVRCEVIDIHEVLRVDM